MKTELDLFAMVSPTEIFSLKIFITFSKQMRDSILYTADCKIIKENLLFLKIT